MANGDVSKLHKRYAYCNTYTVHGIIAQSDLRWIERLILCLMNNHVYIALHKN